MSSQQDLKSCAVDLAWLPPQRCGSDSGDGVWLVVVWCMDGAQSPKNLWVDQSSAVCGAGFDPRSALQYVDADQDHPE